MIDLQISDTMQFATDSLFITCLVEHPKSIIWKLPQKKTKVFGFVGTDRLRTKVIINDESLKQVSHFTHLGCSISY